LVDELEGHEDKEPGPEEREYNSWYSVASSIAHGERLSTLWWQTKPGGVVEVSPEPTGRWNDFARVQAAKHLLSLAGAGSNRWHGGAHDDEIDALARRFADGTL